MTPRSSTRAEIARSALLVLAALGGCRSAVEVNGCAIESLSVQPNSSTIVMGTTVQLQAALQPAGCSAPVLFWSSSDPAMASVTQNGVVTAVAPGGPVTIAASALGRSGTAAVTVIRVPVASVSVAAPRATLLMGQRLQLTAIARDAAGNVLTDRTFTWLSSDERIATVSGSGEVTGTSASGPVTITATAEGTSGQVTLFVIWRLFAGS